MTRTSHVSDRRRFVTRAGKELYFTAKGFGSAPLGKYLLPLSEEDCDETLLEVSLVLSHQRVFHE